jgi:hypothetical protein
MPLNRFNVIETINGKKQELVIMDDIELNQRIYYLAKTYNENKYQLVTEAKGGWYRVEYGDAKSFLRYKKV